MTFSLFRRDTFPWNTWFPCVSSPDNHVCTCFSERNYLCTGEAASPARHENTRFPEKNSYLHFNVFIVGTIVHIVSPPSACVSLVFFHDLFPALSGAHIMRTLFFAVCRMQCTRAHDDRLSLTEQDWCCPSSHQCLKPRWLMVWIVCSGVVGFADPQQTPWRSDSRVGCSDDRAATTTDAGRWSTESDADPVEHFESAEKDRNHSGCRHDERGVVWQTSIERSQ